MARGGSSRRPALAWWALPALLAALCPAPAGAAPARWAALEVPGVRVLHPPGRDAEARAAAGSVRRAIGCLAPQLQGPPPQRITLYLYPSHAEFARDAGVPRRQLVVGIATGNGTIVRVDASGLATDPPAVIAHEVAHLLLDQAAGGAPIPLWFNEGFAERASGDLTESFEALLSQRGASGTLFPLAQLERTFPHEGPDVALAYAQSHALVSHILECAPQDALPALVRRLRAGEPFEQALAAATGRPSAAWDADWRKAFHKEFQWYPWIVFVGGASGVLMALLCVIAYRAICRRKAQLPDDLW